MYLLIFVRSSAKKKNDNDKKKKFKNLSSHLLNEKKDHVLCKMILMLISHFKTFILTDIKTDLSAFIRFEVIHKETYPYHLYSHIPFFNKHIEKIIINLKHYALYRQI